LFVSCFEGEVGLLNYRDFNRVKRCHKATSNPAAYSAGRRCVENIGWRNRAGFINFGKSCRAVSLTNYC